MIINCPECNHEISDKCGNCPHCGYPIQIKEILYVFNGQTYNIIDLVEIMKEDCYSSTVIEEKFNTTKLKEVEFLHDDIVKKYIPEDAEKGYYWSDEFREQYKNQQASNPTNTPKCPTCQSTNIKKISTTSKAVSVGLFGLFSQKVKKQFCCENCGYEW